MRVSSTGKSEDAHSIPNTVFKERLEAISYAGKTEAIEKMSGKSVEAKRFLAALAPHFAFQGTLGEKDGKEDCILESDKSDAGGTTAAFVAQVATGKTSNSREILQIADGARRLRDPDNAKNLENSWEWIMTEGPQGLDHSDIGRLMEDISNGLGIVPPKVEIVPFGENEHETKSKFLDAVSDQYRGLKEGQQPKVLVIANFKHSTVLDAADPSLKETKEGASFLKEDYGNFTLVGPYDKDTGQIVIWDQDLKYPEDGKPDQGIYAVDVQSLFEAMDTKDGAGTQRGYAIIRFD